MAQQRCAPGARQPLRPADGWLIVGALLAAALLAVALYGFSGSGERVRVTVDGAEVALLPLRQERTLTVAGVGGDNTVVIRGGQVTVMQADCPDQICVRHAAISRAGQSIVCLPHRVVVTVVGRGGDVDGEAG